jgi:hypothetical protein
VGSGDGVAVGEAVGAAVGAGVAVGEALGEGAAVGAGDGDGAGPPLTGAGAAESPPLPPPQAARTKAQDAVNAIADNRLRARSGCFILFSLGVAYLSKTNSTKKVHIKHILGCTLFLLTDRTRVFLNGVTQVSCGFSGIFS